VSHERALAICDCLNHEASRNTQDSLLAASHELLKLAPFKVAFQVSANYLVHITFQVVRVVHPVAVSCLLFHFKP
jgi:hypothetical protein